MKCLEGSMIQHMLQPVLLSKTSSRHYRVTCARNDSGRDLWRVLHFPIHFCTGSGQFAIRSSLLFVAVSATVRGDFNVRASLVQKSTNIIPSLFAELRIAPRPARYTSRPPHSGEYHEVSRELARSNLFALLRVRTGPPADRNAQCYRRAQWLKI